MSGAPEEFEKLQKLLKLKRYEQPPPGYFNSFSSHVMDRLDRESSQPIGEVAWLQKLLGLLETNPFAAGAFGMSVCALLISGIVWSQYRPAVTTASSGVALTVADSGITPQMPEWTKTASVDSLMPTMSSFGTNSSMFDGMPQASLTSFQLNQ